MHAQSAVLVRDLVGTGLLFFLWLDDPIKKVLMGHGLQNQFISKCWQRNNRGNGLSPTVLQQKADSRGGS